MSVRQKKIPKDYIYKYILSRNKVFQKCSSINKEKGQHDTERASLRLQKRNLIKDEKFK
jgi:hypothetical protein